MAALLLETVGGTPARNDSLGASVRFDLQARSREFLRRGLVLSGAIHLALLVAFLHLSGNGEDVLARSYGRATDIFRQPIMPHLVPLPPAGAPPKIDAPNQPGIVIPVNDPIARPQVDFTGIGPVDLPGTVGPGPSGPPSGAGPGGGDLPNAPDPGRVYTIAEVEQAPVPVEAPKPLYPEFAREAAVSGRVVTHVLVRSDGTVGRVEVKSGIKVLSDAAQEALYRWRFRPAKMGGRPVAVWVEVPINFTL